MINECGAVGEKRICWGNKSTRRKPVPAPLYPPQIPNDLTWDRTYKLIFTKYYWAAISEAVPVFVMMYRLK
jgi:hypothetical protein